MFRSAFSVTSLKVSTVAAFLALAAPSAAFAKMTVCSATMNSSDEIRSFKEIMGTAEYDYVELTDFAGYNGGSKHAWFQYACQKKVKCDILILSGHFGGMFFGSTKFQLPLETLEKGSCDRTCDGILQNPMEVYLFGCNTLAGKVRDHRTPEQYRRVLIEDGFPREEAERIVSFRYSPFGNSFSDRMRQTFANVPKIYGNHSVGPTGAQIDPSWRGYLKAAKASGYFRNLSRRDTSQNTELLNRLNWSALVQVDGDRAALNEEQPVCKLSGDRLSRTQKLEWIEKTLQSGNYLRSLPHIVEFFQDAEKKKVSFSGREKAVLDRIARLSQVREQIEPLVSRPDDALLGMQLRIYSLMVTLKWITPTEKAAGVSRIVLGDLSRAFNQERIDRMASFEDLLDGVVVDFSSAKIPDARWNDVYFLKTLSLLSYSSSAFEQRLSSIVLNSGLKADVRDAAGEALGSLVGIQGNTVASLLNSVESSSNAGMRRSAALALRTSATETQIATRLANVALAETEDSVRAALIAALPTAGKAQKVSLQAHVAVLKVTASKALRAEIYGRMPALSKADKGSAQIAVAKSLLRETSADAQSLALKTLKAMGMTGWGASEANDAVYEFMQRSTGKMKIEAKTVYDIMKGLRKM